MPKVLPKPAAVPNPIAPAAPPPPTTTDLFGREIRLITLAEDER